MDISSIIYNWLDLIWIPITFIVLPRIQWLEALTVIICSSIMLRLQIEVAEIYGKGVGWTGWLPYDPYHKGLVVYSVIIAIYFLLMLFLVKHKWKAHFLLSLSVFFNAFIISSIVMAI